MTRFNSLVWSSDQFGDDVVLVVLVTIVAVLDDDAVLLLLVTIVAV